MRTRLMLAACAALLAVQPAFADEAKAPEKATACAACHGADGKAVVPGTPHLAGQYANYLEHALREYRSGARKNPIMAGQATGLTDAEIHELARHFSKQAGPLHTPDIHAH